MQTLSEWLYLYDRKPLEETTFQTVLSTRWLHGNVKSTSALKAAPSRAEPRRWAPVHYESRSRNTTDSPNVIGCAPRSPSSKKRKTNIFYTFLSHFQFLFSQKNERRREEILLSLIGTWISPCGTRRQRLTKPIKCLSNDSSVFVIM